MDTIRQPTQKDLLQSYRGAPLRMANTANELFQLLSYFHAGSDWGAFVRAIDFSGVDPRHIYQVVLGRSPEATNPTLTDPEYSPLEHFRAALLSHEFRRHIQRIFLLAHPEKGRDVFIHIPKCAGTDLIMNLGKRAVPLPRMLELDGWLTDDEFLGVVAGLARAARSDQRLFAYGHMELGEYIELAGLRPIDRIFTVLRDPVDLLVSQANYAIGRLRQDPTGEDPDAAEYLKLLGIARLPEDVSLGELKALAVRALLNPEIAEPNRACFYLGRGSQCRFERALEDIISYNVEVTTTTFYERWLQKRWGIAKSERHNRSEPIITRAEALRVARGFLRSATLEDQKLYDTVSWALAKSDQVSVSGGDLTHLVGPGLHDSLARNEAPVPHGWFGHKAPEQKILMADDPDTVKFYLAPIATAIPGITEVHAVVAADFSAAGDSAGYRLDGWAIPEPKFTWTAAKEVRISLPPLDGNGTFVFRMTASPFVHAGKLPTQHVQIYLGDSRLGECRIFDMSVIECEIPAALLRTGEPTTLTLRLPNASLPREVSGANDDRLLALAVHAIAVLRVPPD